MVSGGFEAGVYPHLYTEMVSQKPGYQANLVNKSFLAVKKASDYNKNKMRHDFTTCCYLAVVVKKLVFVGENGRFLLVALL